MTWVKSRTSSRIAGVLLSLGASAVAAQSTDSLTALLSSRDVGVRGVAVVQLAALPTASIPAATRTALITLLEREATGLNAAIDSVAGPDDESWTEYILALSDLAMQFKDARALRGEAFIGIQTSLAIQQFVASFGRRAIPQLDEVWLKSPSGRSAVVDTWGLMLAPGSSLDSASRATVQSRLLAPDDTFPIAFAYAASSGRLVALVPLLDSLAKTARDDIVASVMREASAKLTPQFNAQTPAQATGDLGSWIGAICAHSTARQVRYCLEARTLVAITSTLIKLTGNAGARWTLTALIALTQNNQRRGAIGALQATMIIADAKRISAKLPA